jgi:ketosteroid isomerase-like protein
MNFLGTQMKNNYKVRTLFLSAMAMFLLAACDNTPAASDSQLAQQEITDKAAVAQLYATWLSAVEEGDRQQYVDLLDENITMVPPGAADIVGREAYAKFLIPVFDNAEYKIESLGDIDIQIEGDIALARYDYIVYVSMKAGVANITDSAAALDQMVNKSKYLDVLKRQADGGWKVLSHMWNEAPSND